MPAYYLHIRKGGTEARRAPIMIFNGKSFTNQPDDKPYPFHSAEAAAAKGRRLVQKFGILKDYKMWVSTEFFADPQHPTKSRRVNPRQSKLKPPAGFVKGEHWHDPHGPGVWYPPEVVKAALNKAAKPPKGKSRKKNPGNRAESLDAAAQKLEDFTGHKASHVEKAKPRSNDTTGLVIGELDLIGYKAKRDGKTERYGHHFKRNSRPLLAVSSDGKQLHIVGGQYEFTEAGIEDR